MGRSNQNLGSKTYKVSQELFIWHLSYSIIE